MLSNDKNESQHTYDAERKCLRLHAFEIKWINHEISDFFAILMPFS